MIGIVPFEVDTAEAFAFPVNVNFLIMVVEALDQMVVGNAWVRSSMEGTLEDMVLVVLGGTGSPVGVVYSVVVCREVGREEDLPLN